MATIVFDPDVAEIIGSRRGLTFDKSQAGNYAKKRPSPINSNSTARSTNRKILKDGNTFFWALTQPQKNLWATFAQAAGITGPYGMRKNQQACAGFFTCAINSFTASDEFPSVPGPPIPIAGPTFTALTRIDNNTLRATFNPSPAGPTNRIYLRQALPGPGIRRWSPADGYIAEYSATNPNSPLDLTTKFDHLAGWHCRYWLAVQNTSGGRSLETEFDL